MFIRNALHVCLFALYLDIKHINDYTPNNSANFLYSHTFSSLLPCFPKEEEKESSKPEEEGKMENGDGETEGVKDEGKDGGEGQDDLSLAQKLEKQGDTAQADGGKVWGT